MISVFIRELKRYHLSELCSLFELSIEETISIIRKLKEIGIVKMVSFSQKQQDFEEIFEKDLVLTNEIRNDNNSFYIFKFVGVIIISELVINCYPKYISSSDKPIKEFKQILKVLEKYFSRKQEIKFFESDSFSQSNSRLALYLFLIEDYFENGIYTNDLNTEEINGSGEIDWNKTVSRDATFISNNQPYYYEYITRKRQSDQNDYVKRIHEIVLTTISQELKDANLLELFELTEINLSERNLSDFGDTDLIIYNLEKRLNEQFNTRKRLVILALIAFLNQDIRNNNFDSITLYGSNSFNLVWEDVCQVILNNQLKTPLRLLDLPRPLDKSFNSNDTLQELIEKPFWVVTKNYANETFIPDIVSIEHYKEKYYFIIYDAKYYTAILEPGEIPRKQPGIESISKQFLYHLAFKSFISSQRFDSIKNYFIFPTESNAIIDKKQVTMSIMKEIGLEDIEIRFLPTEMAFDFYLKDIKLDLNLFIE